MNPLSEKRKVVFVSTQMEAGGAQILAVTMTRSLRAQGMDASIVFLYRKRGVFDDEPGAHVLSSSRPRGPLDLLVILIRLIAFVRRNRPDAIVGFAHYSSPLAALAGWLCGVKWRIGTQTSPPDAQGRLARVLDWLAGTLGLYTTNVAASRTIEDHFIRYPKAYRRRTKTIHNGVRLLPSHLSKRDARKTFRLDPEAFLILNIGRLSESKNQMFLLDVIERYEGAHLAILGDGEMRAALESAIAARHLTSRVFLLGEVPPDRVADFLRCGDVFAFPSKYEAFGLALVEAMLAGLPVIAHDYPALREVVGDAGILLPLGDPEAWVAAIDFVRTTPGELADASRRVAVRAEQFSFDTMLDRFKAEWNR